MTTEPNINVPENTLAGTWKIMLELSTASHSIISIACVTDGGEPTVTDEMMEAGRDVLAQTESAGMTLGAVAREVYFAMEAKKGKT